MSALASRRITHIVNCTDDLPNFCEEAAGLTYLRAPERSGLRARCGLRTWNAGDRPSGWGKPAVIFVTVRRFWMGT